MKAIYYEAKSGETHWLKTEVQASLTSVIITNAKKKKNKKAGVLRQNPGLRPGTARASHVCKAHQHFFSAAASHPYKRCFSCWWLRSSFKHAFVRDFLISFTFLCQVTLLLSTAAEVWERWCDLWGADGMVCL